MNALGRSLALAPETETSLRRLVWRLASNRLWDEDLMQEARIHLWRQEEVHPGQSRAWYMQSCKYHLCNYLRKGRSVDSPKRRGKALVPSPAPGHAWWQRDGGADGSEAAAVFEQASAHDLLATLESVLSASERQVLQCLLDGETSREAARHLKVSHTWVNQKKRRIVTVCLALVD